MNGEKLKANVSHGLFHGHLRPLCKNVTLIRNTLGN